MELIQNQTENSHLIASVSESKIFIDKEVYEQSCIISNKQVVTDIALTHIDELNAKHIDDLLATNPEVILFGSGMEHQFPNVELLQPIAKSLVGFEVMNNGAAARTYNIMVAEERKVACLLILAS